MLQDAINVIKVTNLQKMAILKNNLFFQNGKIFSLDLIGNNLLTKIFGSEHIFYPEIIRLQVLERIINIHCYI